MTPQQTVRTLLTRALAGAEPRPDRQVLAARMARAAWARQAGAAVAAAARAADQAWTRAIEALPDPSDEAALNAMPEPPEQARLDRLISELGAAAHHDRWPRRLHWTV